ncbi:hypothetical protein TESS_TESS_02840 [Tessaracoccus sp. O5.2]|uniref:helix-turn-helix domain-containing protein n=1 Tax=Tessaracoccus sp. O5.2 TaxID=3157622 RepID=UPI0035EA090C
MDARARWRILRLHVEDQVPLARLARETDVGLRTLERWHARYRADGYAGLETASRADTGSRRLPPDLVHLIEGLALSKPRPAIAVATAKSPASAPPGSGRSPPTRWCGTSCGPWIPAWSPYRPLGQDELLFVLERHWRSLGKPLDPDDFTDAQAIAAIARITRGNFRLLERLFPQIQRVLKINELDTITNDVIEAAQSTLVIGVT